MDNILVIDGIDLLHWTARPLEGSAEVIGTNIASFDGGRLRSIHVFLDQADA